MTPPVDSIYYNDVSKNQQHLTDEEEISLFTRYEELKNSLHDLITQTTETKKQLEIIYYNILVDGKSPAKMSSFYNNKSKGQNKKITKKLKKAFKENNFDDISFSLEIYYQTAEFLPTEKDKQKFNLIKKEILEIEEKIFRTTLMASIRIADKYASDIFGIEVKDAIQEANKEILESIKKYNVNYKGKNGKRVKFITYAYKNATKKVKEHIMNHSRLVRIPRTKLDVIFLVIQVMNKTASTVSTAELCKKINQILLDRKGRQLSPRELITEGDVTEAIELLSGNPIPLDHRNIFTNKDGSASRAKTLGDLIPDEYTPTPEQSLLLLRNKEELIKECSQRLNDIEFKIIYYKYLQTGDERSLKEVQNILSVENKQISRERINQIKKSAFSKLKKSKKFKELLLEGIK